MPGILGILVNNSLGGILCGSEVPLRNYPKIFFGISLYDPMLMKQNVVLCSGHLLIQMYIFDRPKIFVNIIENIVQRTLSCCLPSLRLGSKITVSKDNYQQ